MMSIFQPLAVRPQSSAAIWAASVEPGPARSAYSPDWSDSAPILTVLSWAAAKPAEARLSALPSNNDAINLVFILISSLGFFSLCSDAEIGVELVHIGLQLRIGKTVDDLAVFDDVIAVRDSSCEREILLDQKDGETFLLEPRDGVADLLDDDGSQPLGRLVQHQEPGAGAQNSCDRQHLLLAAGQFGALAVEPLLQIGKQLEDLIQRQTAAAHDRRQQQVFPDVEAGENPALFRG